MIEFGDYATLLDSFTRADEGPPMTGWTAWISPGLNVLSDQLAPADSGDNGGYFSTAMGGPDVEAYITIVTHPAVGGGQSALSVRLDPSTGGEGSHYQLAHNPAAGTDTMDLWQVTAGAYTRIGGPWNQELAAGDKIGLRCQGSTIEPWVYTGGQWVKIASVTDTTHDGSGNQNKIGIYNYGNATAVARYDDLYGGVIDLQPTVLSADSLALTPVTPD